MKKIVLLLIALQCLFLTSVIQAENDKYFLEKYYTDLAQVMLNSMFGEGNFVARVKVDMTDPKYEVKYTEESKPKSSGAKKKSEEVYILPGVPALKNIAPGSLNQLPYNSVTTMMEARLRRMTVFILVDKNYPKSQARKAESAIKQLLDFNDNRDRFTMEYKPFYDNPLSETQTIKMVPGPENFVSIENIINYIIILILLVGVIMHILLQKKLIAATAEKDEGGGPSVSVNPNLELPEGMGGGSDSNISLDANSIKRFFDFVSNDNIDDFITLVKQQALKPEFVSLIASFLPGKLSAKLIKAMDAKLQAHISADLVEQKMGNRQMLEKLETKLKNDLECFSGGADKFSKIFDNMSSEEKKGIIQLVQKSNPQKYKLMRPHVLLFDDIVKLEEEEIQNLLSDINLDTLATALVGVNQSINDFIMNNLTKSAKDIVSQYLQIKGTDAPKDETEKAQDSIVKIIKKMSDKGIIKLAGKIK